MASPSHLHFFFPIPSALLRYLLLLFALPSSLSFSPRCHISSAEAGEGGGREKRGGQKRDPFPPWVLVATGREKRGEEREIVFLAFSSFSSFPPHQIIHALWRHRCRQCCLCVVYTVILYSPPPQKKEGGRNNKTDRPREAIIILLHR